MASIEILSLANVTYPPRNIQPFPSVRRLISHGCDLEMGEMPTVLMNLQICGLDRETIMINFILIIEK